MSCVVNITNNPADENYNIGILLGQILVEITIDASHNKRTMFHYVGIRSLPFSFDNGRNVIQVKGIQAADTVWPLIVELQALSEAVEKAKRALACELASTGLLRAAEVANQVFHLD